MKRKIYHLITSLLYPAVDFIAVALAILSSYKLYSILGIGKQVYYEKPEIFIVSLFASFITVMVLLGFGGYKRKSSVLNVEEIKNVIEGLTITFMLFAVILVFTRFSPSRYVLIFSYIFSLIFILTEKFLLYHILSSSALLKDFNKRIIIYGAGELGHALYRSIVSSPKMGIVPVGFIDDDPDKQNEFYYQSGFNCSDGVSVLGTGKDIKRLKEELDIDEVYVAISNIDNSSLINILDYLKSKKISASFVPNLYKVLVHKVNIVKIGEIPVVTEEDGSGYSYYLHIKRYIDLSLALVLLFLSLPIIGIIALAIKMDSKGPVFFRQDRVGKNGKTFQIYKFRSMLTDTDPYSVNPSDQNDPRITSVGKFLRKTSLDELPQIINVLKGDMSFVGPRPEMPFIVAEYDEIHKERLKVLPGITGLWQLSGDRKKAIHENMDYDLYYIRNASFFLDVAILIQTLIFAFRGI